MNACDHIGHLVLNREFPEEARCERCGEQFGPEEVRRMVHEHQRMQRKGLDPFAFYQVRRSPPTDDDDIPPR